MNKYKDKYLKYKNKYIALKYGNFNSNANHLMLFLVLLVI